MLKRNSIFTKTFLNYSFIAIFSLMLITILFFNILKNELFKYQKEALTNTALSIASFYNKNDLNVDIEKLQKLAKDLNIRITIIDPSGVVLWDSDKFMLDMENHKFRPEIQEAYSGSIGVDIRFSSTMKTELLYIAVPIFKNNEILGAVRVSKYLVHINNLLNFYHHKIYFYLMVFVLFIFIFSYLFAKKISSPLNILANLTRNFIGKQISPKFLSKSYYEIGVLSKDFEEMSNKINVLFDDLNSEKQKMNAILEALGVGILVVDKNDNIVLFNKVFEGYVGIKFEMNKNYIQQLREHILIEEIRKTRLEKISRIKECFLKGSNFLCSFNYSFLDGNVIVILQNIDGLKKIEEIKKDFVANVSHELRTPISAIKGFIETMEEEQKYSQEYVDVIKHNTERMSRIVADLLLLSRLEAVNKEINIEKIDAKTIKEIIENIAKIENKNNIDFKCEILVDSLNFDKNMFDTVMTNLITNAFKYTDKGNIDVKIWEDERAQKFISVKNTGVEIPESLKDRIFERFFVVDKARSKKTGGTGLGLAIVKHILILHQAKIFVNCGGGITEFLIKLA